MIHWENDAYSSKSESTQRNQVLHLVTYRTYHMSIIHDYRQMTKDIRCHSSKVRTHQTWCVRIDGATSIVACAHPPMLDDISQGQ